MRTFFDTNVLAYLYDDEFPERKVQAQAVFETETKLGQAVVSTQVLQEFYVTVTRKLAVPLPTESAEEVVRNLASLIVINVDIADILAAIVRSRVSGFSFWDALIVETAIRSGASRLLSEDLQDGQVIDGMRVENPFRTVGR